MKAIIEKLSRMSKQAVVTVSQRGQLSLRVTCGSTATVINSFFSSLEPRFEGGLDAETDFNNSAVVTMDSKRLTLMMGFHAAAYARALLCM